MDAPGGVGPSVTKFRFRNFRAVGAIILAASSLGCNKVGGPTNEIIIEVFAADENM